MSPQNERRLVSLRREVPQDRSALHAELWEAVSRPVTAAGGHAWRFVSSADERQSLEFLEFKAGSDPRRDPRVAEALKRLDEAVGPAQVEEWLEAR